MKKLKSYGKAAKKLILRTAGYLGARPFLLFIALLALEVGLAGALFFEYVHRPQQDSIRLRESQLKFQEETFKGILAEWESRERLSQEETQVRNLFLQIPSN